jgi:hypothetical protein
MRAAAHGNVGLLEFSLESQSHENNRKHITDVPAAFLAAFHAHPGDNLRPNFIARQTDVVQCLLETNIIARDTNSPYGCTMEQVNVSCSKQWTLQYHHPPHGP